MTSIKLLAGALALAAVGYCQAAPLPALTSDSFVVADARTGKPIIGKSADAVVPIASLTKLMTAMVLMDKKLNMSEKLTIEQEDVDRLKFSKSHLTVGTGMSRRQALLLALMASENRAAHALARTYPGGVPAFVSAMNRKSRELGLAKASFFDPTGLSPANRASATDMAKIVQAASAYSLIREFSTTKEATVGRLAFHNTNPLIRAAKSSWDIQISKTGYTQEAGRCLALATRIKNKPVVMVVLDAPSNQTRVADIQKLRQWLIINS